MVVNVEPAPRIMASYASHLNLVSAVGVLRANPLSGAIDRLGRVANYR